MKQPSKRKELFEVFVMGALKGVLPLTLATFFVGITFVTLITGHFPSLGLEVYLVGTFVIATLFALALIFLSIFTSSHNWTERDAKNVKAFQEENPENTFFSSTPQRNEFILEEKGADINK